VVTQADVDRPDNIAQRVYGSPDYWWAILDYNRINDPFSLEVGDRLRIPIWSWPLGTPLTPQVISLFDNGSDEAVSQFGDGTLLSLQQRSSSIQNGKTLPLTPSIYRPPAYVRPGGVDQTEDPLGVDVADPMLFNLAIPIPNCLVGTAHFQLQLASDGAYADVVLSRLTATSTARWFYYDPFYNSGAGSHLPFPQAGLDAATYAGQPVYFQLKESDGLIRGNQYYPRFRAVINDVDSQWVGLPPITIPD
jgi:hypothetical protein